MAQKKAHEVDSFLKSPGKGWVVTLVYGPDRGLVSERAALIARASGVPLDDPFSLITMNADAISEDPGRLMDEANTMSMFGGDRLIWIKSGSNDKKFVDALRHLIDNPPTGCTVLVEADDLKKTALLRTLVEGGTNAMALPCYSDDARALDRLIDEELAREGKTISLEARSLLKQSLGGDRMSSRQEMGKLVLYCLDNKNIELEDVQASVAEAASSSVDDAVDAVIGGRVDVFEREYARLIANGTAPYQFIRTAMRQFYVLANLRKMVDQDGKSATAAVASARPPLFFGRKALFETAVAKIRQPAIIEALDKLQSANLESRKFSGMTAIIVHRALLGIAIERSRAR
jgi:DNA polymerase III subunit delta